MPGCKAQPKQTRRHRLDLPVTGTTFHLCALSRALKVTAVFNPVPLHSPTLWFPSRPTSQGMTVSKPRKITTWTMSARQQLPKVTLPTA